MKIFLFYFASAGWLICLTIHGLTFADIDVRNYIPGIEIICIAALFIVWLPTIFSLRSNTDFNQLQQGGIINRLNPIKAFKALFKGTPNWLAILAVTCFYYACVNFFVTLHANGAYTPEAADGKYFLMNHSEVVKALSLQQYQHYKALEMRLASGHFSGFFGFATAVLYPFKKQATSLVA